MDENLTSEAQQTEPEHVNNAEEPDTLLHNQETLPASENLALSQEKGEPETLEDTQDHFNFSIPEHIDIDQKALEDFRPVAESMRISPQNMQSLVDIAIDMHDRAQTSQKEQEETLNTQWIEKTKNDPDIGGVHLQNSVATAQHALQSFASPELISILDHTGLGNHPDMVKMFCAIGKAISEDRFITSNSGAPARRSLEQILYG